MDLFLDLTRRKIREHGPNGRHVQMTHPLNYTTAVRKLLSVQIPLRGDELLLVFST
jgi:hypothetical protein